VAEPNGSIVVTCFLCAGLVVGNYWVLTHGMSYFNWLFLWPVAFILCTVIFARILRGHSSL